VEDIYARVTNGIPNTPMPSFFADKTGNGKLSEEDRWHVANYVKSLEETEKMVKDGSLVIKGVFRETLPADEKDVAWDDVDGVGFMLVPQIIAKERFFIPANDLVYVKAIYNAKEIVLLVEWDDRSKSVPGDPNAAAIAWGPLKPDAIAVQTPVDIPTASEKPYFGHGDGSHAVSMLYWSAGSTESGPVSAIMSATGVGAREPGDAAAVGMKVSSSYEFGSWKVMIRRIMKSPEGAKTTSFEPGKYIPIAFANWDGSNSEGGSQHTMTSWMWLLLEPEVGSEVVAVPVGMFLLLVMGQLAAAAYLRKNDD
jgi:DMSO reductase family type II enzyme heme b subunit